METSAVRWTATNGGHSSFEVLRAEEGEGDDKVNVRALYDAFHSGVWPAGEVDSGRLNLKGQCDMYREGDWPRVSSLLLSDRLSFLSTTLNICAV